MKKKILSLSALLLAIAVGLWVYQYQTSDFAALHSVSEYLFEQTLSQNTINLHYTLATPEAYGLKDIPVTLGTYSVSEMKKQSILTENALSVLSSISRDALSPDDQLTCDILLHNLKQQLDASKYPLYPEPLSSQGILTELPVLLAEYSFRSQDDIDDYLQLLDCLPSYFEDLGQYETEKANAGLFMSDNSLDKVLANCQAVCDQQEQHFMQISFENRIDSLASLSTEEKIQYQLQHDQVLQRSFFPSYQKLSDTLVSLRGKGKNPYGLYYHEQGTAYYEYLTASCTGTDYTLKDIKQMILTRLKSDYTELSSLLSKNPALSTAVLSIGTSVGQLSKPVTPEEMLSDLYDKTKLHFPIPTDAYASAATDYQVKYVDTAMEAFLSPAFYLTPPIDLLSENTIYINDVSSYSDIRLYTTLAHEGYPGHMLQNTYYLSTEPAPVRSLLYFGAYSEGWAVYTEQYAYTLLELDEDLTRVLQLDHLLQLGLCSLLDLMVHYEGLTPDGLQQFASRSGLLLDESILSELYQQIVDQPANYLKYYVGFLEVDRLRTKAEAALGDSFCEMDFHEFFLSVGPAPFSIIEKREDIWIQTVLSSDLALCSQPLISSSSSLGTISSMLSSWN